MKHVNYSKLNSIITKLINLVEDDLHTMDLSETSKKNIADVLAKIVSVMTNMQKLDKGDYKESLTTEDKKILDHFLNKHHNNE